MKNILYPLLLAGLLLSQPTVAQDHPQQIKKTLKAYFELLEKGEMKKSLDYLYPRFFEVVPRAQIEKSMDDARTKSILVRSPQLLSLSNIITVNKSNYALATYQFKLFVKKAGADETALQNFASFFQQVYGKDNVSIDKANQQLVIQAKGEMFVINDPAYAGWKVLEKKKDSRMLLEKLLPQEVLKKL
jgi:hypothetical protein